MPARLTNMRPVLAALRIWKLALGAANSITVFVLLVFQVLVEKLQNGSRAINLAFFLAEAVTFVRKDYVLDRNTIFSDRCHDVV